MSASTAELRLIDRLHADIVAVVKSRLKWYEHAMRKAEEVGFMTTLEEDLSFNKQRIC